MIYINFTGKSLIKIFANAANEKRNYGIYSIRSIVLDGTPQDMPRTHLYTDKFYSVTSGTTSSTTSRFDWFWTKDGDYLQLLALVQLCYPEMINDKVIIKSIYFHISADTTRIQKNKYPTINGNRYVITYLFNFLHNIINIYISFM